MNGALVVLIVVIVVAVIFFLQRGIASLMFKEPLFPNISVIKKRKAERESNKEQEHDTHVAKSLVLSCMDYRFINDTIEYLYGRSNEADFDYFVLAGASLGFNQSKEDFATKEIPGDVPNGWYRSYLDHVRLAIELHQITEIVVIDHMDCGYYRAIYGDAVDTPQKEQNKHAFNLHKFVTTMKEMKEFKNLSYVTLLAEKNGDKITFKEI